MDVDLREVDTAIAMVARGPPCACGSSACTSPTTSPRVALARAQPAGIGFRIDRLGSTSLTFGRPRSRSPDVRARPSSARPPRMVTVPRIERAAFLRFLAVAVPSLAGATLAVAVLQDRLGVPNPSALYLLAVVATAVVSGTRPPRSRRSRRSSSTTSLRRAALHVHGRQPRRAAQPLPAAVRRVRGRPAGGPPAGTGRGCDRPRARGSRAVRGQPRARDPRVHAVGACRRSPTSSGRGGDGPRLDLARRGDARERVAADTDAGSERPSRAGLHHVLQRTPGDTPARWTRVHQPLARVARGRPGDVEAYRVRMEAAGEAYGSIWALRPRRRGEPDRTETRLLAAAADQIGQALRAGPPRGRGAGGRDRPPERRPEVGAAAVGVARPANAAGHDPGGRRDAPAGRHASSERGPAARAPTRSTARSSTSNRLVTNLLDLSGSRPARCGPSATSSSSTTSSGGPSTRLAAAARPAGRSRSTLDVAAGRASIRSSSTRRSRTPSRTRIKYTAARHPIRVARQSMPAMACVRLTVEDGGPGVPDAALPRLFEKFYRVPGRRGGIAVRDRHRAGGRSRPGRGDGRPRRRAPERARRPGDRPRPAGRPRAGRVGRRGGARDRRLGGRRTGPTVLVVEDDDETRAGGRSRARGSWLPGRRGGRRPHGARALGGVAGPTSSCSTSACPTWTGCSVIRRIRREATTPIVILSGALRGAREGRGAGARRRRLRDQAVRGRRAATRGCGSPCAMPPGPAADAAGRIVVGPLVLDVGRATRCASTARRST